MKKIWIIIIIGILIRLLLSLVSFHSDIVVLDFAAKLLREGNILNFYDYLYNLPLGDQITKIYPAYTLNYPPAIYLFHGLFSLFFINLFSVEFTNSFLFNFPSTLGRTELNVHLLFLKLPYLIFDLGIAWFLWQWFSDKKAKFLALTMWIFNPVNLYVTYMMGQFDIITTFFVVAALFVVKKNIHFSRVGSLSLAALLLGIGASFKLFPFFLMVPLITLVNAWSSRIKILLLGVLPYILVLLPFLPSRGFRSAALVAGQTLKSFYAQIPISGGENIILFLATLIFFYLRFIYQKGNPGNLWERFFITLILFFVFTHYHPQWFLLLTPFLILDLIKSNMKNILLVGLMLFSFTGLLFFFDSGLTIGLLAPVFPELYNSATIWQILRLNVDYNLSRSILQTVFVGSALYYIYSYSRLTLESEN